MIVAMTEDRVIGSKNKLPWPSIKEDMRHFKDITMGRPVIMGRKTWESIPEQYRPLPGRTNIVVTRQENLTLPGSDHIFNNLEIAVEFAKTLDEHPFIIGGSSLYQEGFSLADQIYLTLIKGNFEGDTYLPEFDLDTWKVEMLKETDKAIFYLYERKLLSKA